ncbi:21241_t:CDS:2, partial [Racocetra persica]
MSSLFNFALDKVKVISSYVPFVKDVVEKVENAVSNRSDAVHNLNRIKEFTNEVSKLQGLKKILEATYITKKYENLMKELDTLMMDLDLSHLLENWFQKAINNYDLKEIPFINFGKLKFVGRGAFGNVFRTSCKSIKEEVVAIKEMHIEDNETDIKMFLNELKLHGQVSHQGIIQLYGVSKDYDRGAYYLVMEYANCGTLEQYLEKNAMLSWDNK